MRLLLLLTLSLLTTQSIKAQVSQSQLKAREHINNLKEGILLIRLEDKAKKLDYYKKQGNTELADKIQIKTEHKNDVIMKAFADHYEFSNYAFYYMNDSRAVLNKKDYSSLFDSKGNAVNAIGDKVIYICTIDQGIIAKEKVLNHPGYQIYFLSNNEEKQVFTRLVNPFPNGAKFKLPFVSTDVFFEKEIKRLHKDLNKFFHFEG